MSARRLIVLINELRATSSLARALNGGELPWTNTDHRIADLWKLWAKQEHPIRADMQAKHRTAVKTAKVIDMKRMYEKTKSTYGLE